MDRKKLLIVIFIILVVGIVGYFSLVKNGEPIIQQTPTPAPIPTQPPVTQPPISAPINEIEKWKTYRDEKYRFEVKYPPDWEEMRVNSSALGSDGKIYSTISTTGFRESHTSNYLSFSVTSVTTEKPDFGYPYLYPSQANEPYKYLIDGEHATKEYLDSTLCNDDSRGCPTNVAIWLQHNSKFFMFFLSFRQTPTIANTFDQILSTFKFIR